VQQHRGADPDGSASTAATIGFVAPVMARTNRPCGEIATSPASDMNSARSFPAVKVDPSAVSNTARIASLELACSSIAEMPLYMAPVSAFFSRDGLVALPARRRA
jgi:hypothetical protein